MTIIRTYARSLTLGVIAALLPLCWGIGCVPEPKLHEGTDAGGADGSDEPSGTSGVAGGGQEDGEAGATGGASQATGGASPETGGRETLDQAGTGGSSSDDERETGGAPLTAEGGEAGSSPEAGGAAGDAAPPETGGATAGKGGTDEASGGRSGTGGASGGKGGGGGEGEPEDTAGAAGSSQDRGGAGGFGGSATNVSTGGSGTGGVDPTGGAAGQDSTTSPYDGRWAGLTSQGLMVQFDVFSGAVFRAEYDWGLQVPVGGGVYCIANGETSSSFTPAVIDGDGRFSKGPVGGSDVSYTLAGTLTSAVAATGTIDMTRTYPGCSGSALLTWTAEKVVCGDERIEWPESCDDGNDTPDDGCSELCQLTPIVEQEPNDDLVSAAPAVTDDTVFSGSLSTSLDLDVYAVRNPHAGLISIKFETHGETMGTCRVDTLLEVYNADGELLAGDDDGARSWFCSQLTVPVDSGQTVYVLVAAATDEAIPRYNLHVRYPHS